VINISIDNDRTDFCPGESIQGTVEWSFSSVADAIDVELMWKTRGKGTVDECVATTSSISTGGRGRGSSKFVLTAPRGPYSFSGKLISLIWYVSGSAPRIKETCEKEIVIGPDGTEVRYYDGPARAK
jgi:hypothetical protein